MTAHKRHMLGRPEQGNISLWAIILAHAPVEYSENRRCNHCVADSTTTVTFISSRGSEENDAADRVVLFSRRIAAPGLGLGIDVFADQSHTLRQAVIEAENARRVALEQQRVCVYLARIFIIGELQIRYAVAETDFELVEFVGRLHVAAVGLALGAGRGRGQYVEAGGADAFAVVTVQHSLEGGVIDFDADVEFRAPAAGRYSRGVVAGDCSGIGRQLLGYDVDPDFAGQSIGFRVSPRIAATGLKLRCV